MKILGKIIVSLLFPVVSLKAQNSVKILSYHVDDTLCNTWKYNINKDSIQNNTWHYVSKDSLSIILSSMTPLRGEEHHCCYNNWSCFIEGEVLYKGKKYYYYLNAGGWALLASSDNSEQFLLACTDSKYFKYFISVFDPPSDD